MRTLLLYAFLILVFSACKEDGVVTDPYLGPYRVSKIEVVDVNGDTLEYGFEYAADSRIRQIYLSPGTSSTIEFQAGNAIDHDYIIISGDIPSEYQRLNAGLPYNIRLNQEWQAFLKYSGNRLDTIENYCNDASSLCATKIYHYSGGRLDSIVVFTSTGNTTEKYQYNNGKLTYFDECTAVYSGEKLSVLNYEKYNDQGVSNMGDDGVTMVLTFDYDAQTELLKSIRMVGSKGAKQWDDIWYIHYEQGEGVFPYYWRKPAWEILGTPEFLPHLVYRYSH